MEIKRIGADSAVNTKTKIIKIETCGIIYTIIPDSCGLRITSDYLNGSVLLMPGINKEFVIK